MAVDDLATATADYVQPIGAEYRGHTPWECPPKWSGRRGAF